MSKQFSSADGVVCDDGVRSDQWVVDGVECIAKPSDGDRVLLVDASGVVRSVVCDQCGERMGDEAICPECKALDESYAQYVLEAMQQQEWPGGGNEGVPDDWGVFETDDDRCFGCTRSACTGCWMGSRWTNAPEPKPGPRWDAGEGVVDLCAWMFP